MFGQLFNCTFSILILLIFTSTSVYGITCNYYQKLCGNYPSYWCCDDNKECGDYYPSCRYHPRTTTSTPSSSSDLPPHVIVIIVVSSILFFTICLCFCIFSHQKRQHLRTSYVGSNAHLVTNPYQPSQGLIRVAHIRPVYNVGVAPPYESFPSRYEEPPPSYEAATANIPRIHQSSRPMPIPGATE